MTVPRGTVPAAVVVCPVRAAAAIVRWVAGRSGFGLPAGTAQEIVDEEFAAWRWEGTDD